MTLASPGLYLVDFVVRPPFRGRAIGKSLLVPLARLAVERGCSRSNGRFSAGSSRLATSTKRLGGEAIPWLSYRIAGEALEGLANFTP